MSNDDVRHNALGTQNGGMGYVDTSDPWANIPPHVREYLTDVARNWPAPHTPQPTYGELYDTLRTKDGWDRFVDFSFDGTITPSTSAPVAETLSPITESQPINLRQGLYPGGVQAYPCVRLFSITATAGTATGALKFFWIDPSGNILPLGTAPAANTQYAITPNIISPTPITDNNVPTMGQLQIQMVSGATPVTLAYEVGISIVYLRPATVAVAPTEYVHDYGMNRHGGRNG